MPDKSPLEIIREQIKTLLSERDEHQQRMDSVLSGVEQRGDGAFNEDERTQFNEARDAIKALDEKREALQKQETDMLEAQRARDAAAEASRRYTGSDAPTPVRVTNEPEVYRAGGEHSFFSDAHARHVDPDAADRIMRNQRAGMDRLRREARAVGTSAFGALVVPQFLTDMYAPLARAGRPLINAANSMPLPPEGTALNIPRGTTGTAVASQTSENFSVTDVDFDETTLTVNMRTIAGQQNISRQSLDRGTPGLDQIIMEDLAAAYASELDRQAIEGTGTAGQHLGLLSVTDIGSVTYSVSGETATVPGVYVRIADGIQRINTNRHLPPTAIFMHPRRWGWFLSKSDSNGRPLALASDQVPQNAMGVGNAAQVGQVVGQIMSVPVVTDANIPTSVSSTTSSGATEDVIIIARTADWHLWENGAEPTMVEFRETLSGQLTVKVVAWDYTFWTAERYPTATIVISGSCLTTPTFT